MCFTGRFWGCLLGGIRELEVRGSKQEEVMNMGEHASTGDNRVATYLIGSKSISNGPDV